ncbi:hypothetical protein [Streptomyces sp. P17]|uniref:hypothetical protein n=1 Tax=Streptomyces sp. P17 TaxID=3074716 RepID=UPI0028F444EE|nr:hypothetical protein [Streptomyces sp. P17]MDT9700726.1 hypothetical protein [Streptomyces sp. P17]
MPFPPPPRMPSGPRRRSLLAAATGAALLVGCSPGSDTDGTGGSPSAADRARARAARDSAELVDRYDAVIAVRPALADRLQPLRAEVVRHAEAFGGTAARTATPSASASASTVPSDEKGALAELAAAERTLADRRTEELLELPGELARLLASVAAAGAAHVYLLTEGDA